MAVQIQQIPTDFFYQNYIDFYCFKDVVEVHNTSVKLRLNPWKDDILQAYFAKEYEYQFTSINSPIIFPIVDFQLVISYYRRRRMRAFRMFEYDPIDCLHMPIARNPSRNLDETNGTYI